MKKEKVKLKPPVGLVFAEDANDGGALINLANCVRGDLPPLKFKRKPLILVRDRAKAEVRKNADSVLAVVRAAEVINTVKLVIAHQDCDDFEPAHICLSDDIENELTAAGVAGVVPVAPAWEIEAWWFLWPAAVSAVNESWVPLKRKGNHGNLKDAKETLRGDLKKGKKVTRDYEESDSIAISKNVQTLKIFGKRQGSCASFDLYVAKLSALQI